MKLDREIVACGASQIVSCFRSYPPNAILFMPPWGKDLTGVTLRKGMRRDKTGKLKNSDIARNLGTVVQELLLGRSSAKASAADGEHKDRKPPR